MLLVQNLKQNSFEVCMTDSHASLYKYTYVPTSEIPKNYIKILLLIQYKGPITISLW